MKDFLHTEAGTCSCHKSVLKIFLFKNLIMVKDQPGQASYFKSMYDPLAVVN